MSVLHTLQQMSGFSTDVLSLRGFIQAFKDLQTPHF